MPRQKTSKQMPHTHTHTSSLIEDTYRPSFPETALGIRLTADVDFSSLHVEINSVLNVLQHV